MLLLQQFLQKLLLFFLLQIDLVLNLFPFLLCFVSDFVLFPLKLFLELLHLFFVLNLHNLFIYDLIIDNTVFAHDLLRVNTRVKGLQLLL